MSPLLLAALAILAAPVFDRLLRGRPSVSVAVHDLARVAVFGVVAVHMLPHGIAVAGAVAIPAVLAGVFAASALERPLESRDGASWVPIAVALALHQAIDGVALAQPDDGPFLPIAVILHTIPIALLAWRFSTLRGGGTSGAVTLAGMIVATGAGYAVASMGPPSHESALASLVECFLGGALVHVLAHRHDEASRDRPLASGVGTLAGIAVVGTLLAMHPTPRRFQGELSLDESFLLLATALAPAVLLGAAVVGFLRPKVAPKWGGDVGALAGIVALAGPMPALVAVLARAPAIVERRTRTQVTGGVAPAHTHDAHPHHGHTHHAAHDVAQARHAPAAHALDDHAHDHAHDGHGGHAHDPTRGAHDGHAHPPAASGLAAAAHRAHDHDATTHHADVGKDAAARPPALPAVLDALDHALPWLLAGLIVAAIAEPSLDASAFAYTSPLLLAAALGLAVLVVAPSSLAALPLGAVLVHKGAPVALVVAAVAVASSDLPRWRAARLGTVVAGLVIGLVGTRLMSGTVPLHDTTAFGDGRVALGLVTVAALDMLRRRGLDGVVAEVLGEHDHHHR